MSVIVQVYLILTEFCDLNYILSSLNMIYSLDFKHDYWWSESCVAIVVQRLVFVFLMFSSYKMA